MNLLMPDIVIIPDSEDIADEIEETGDEIEALSEQLATHATASETQHTQIIEGVDLCRTRLETLSLAATSENPALIQISSQLVALQTELTNLRTLFTERAIQAPPSVIVPSFDPEVIEEPMDLDLPNEVPLTVEQPGEIQAPTSERKTQRMS